ncbi:MAG: SDR family NAD(P)-dependent oxidoreductase, partial [Dehalococcoidia bacterium]
MPYDGLSLVGQTALVTGSGRGIGAALAVGLAQAGATVAVSDRPDRLDLAEETKAKVEAEGAKSGVYPLDVLDLPSIPKAIDQVVKDFGRLDILVNNAGIRIPKPAL